MKRYYRESKLPDFFHRLDIQPQVLKLFKSVWTLFRALFASVSSYKSSEKSPFIPCWEIIKLEMGQCSTNNTFERSKHIFLSTFSVSRCNKTELNHPARQIMEPESGTRMWLELVYFTGISCIHIKKYIHLTISCSHWLWFIRDIFSSL